MRSVLAVCLMLAMLGGLSAVEPVDPHVSAPAEDQVRELFGEGLRLYKSGRHDEAALRFRDAMLLAPPARLVFEFYRAAGDRVMMDMEERAELSEVMRDILRTARHYHTTLRRDARYIELLITKLRGSERERLAATHELVAVGPVAIPYLVDKLRDSRQEDFRVWCRMVLSRMGYRAVIPLTEALKGQDEARLSSIVTILGDIADPRPLPKLQQMVTDPANGEVLKRVLRNTIAAIASRARMGTIADGPQLYFQEAMRYFRDGDEVRDEMIANESLMWRWFEEPDDDESMQLQYVQVPQYAWNELIAEQLLFDGAGYYPEFTAYAPLLAAVLSAQKQEVEIRLALAGQRTYPARLPEEEVAALRLRDEALDEMLFNVRMIDPAALYRAVQQSIVSERYDVAVRLMDLLQDRWLAKAEDLLPSQEEGLMAEKPGTVLVAALEHPEKRVRYNAAATLAHLDPLLRFFNAEKVVPLLAEAVGEWGMIAVMVIEEDFRHRNAARAELQSQGLLSFSAADGFEARSRISESPIKDAVIISGTLQPGLRDPHGVIIDVEEQTPEGMIEVLRSDPRTADAPIFMAVPENAELSAKIKNAFEGRVDGFVQRPYNGAEMRGLIENALGDHQLPDLNRQQREQISLNAARALGAIDPVSSQFPIAAAAEALADTVANRSDTIRIATLRALGQTGAVQWIDRVNAAYESQAEQLVGKPELRAAFLYCIGLLDPNRSSSVAILKEALIADERQVREAASAAIGHGRGTPEPILWDFQRLRRFDVRAPGVSAQ